MNHPFVQAPLMEEEEMIRSFEREDAHPLSDAEILERLKNIRTYCEEKDERIINVQASYRRRSVSRIFVSEKKILDQQSTVIRLMIVVHETAAFAVLVNAQFGTRISQVYR